MKIVGWNGRFGCFQRFEMAGPDRKDAIDVLHFAIDHEVRVIEDDGAFTIENVGHDDSIGDTGLVFQAQKEQPFSGSGSLAANDASGDADRPAIVDELKLSSGRDADQTQLLAMESQRMLADGEVGAAKIGVEAFGGIHRSERRFWRGFDGRGKQRTSRTQREFGIP